MLRGLLGLLCRLVEAGEGGVEVDVRVICMLGGLMALTCKLFGTIATSSQLSLYICRAFDHIRRRINRVEVADTWASSHICYLTTNLPHGISQFKCSALSIADTFISISHSHQSYISRCRVRVWVGLSSCTSRQHSRRSHPINEFIPRLNCDSGLAGIVSRFFEVVEVSNGVFLTRVDSVQISLSKSFKDTIEHKSIHEYPLQVRSSSRPSRRGKVKPTSSVRMSK